jgi:hypothetical protein
MWADFRRLGRLPNVLHRIGRQLRTKTKRTLYEYEVRLKSEQLGVLREVVLQQLFDSRLLRGSKLAARGGNAIL